MIRKVFPGRRGDYGHCLRSTRYLYVLSSTNKLRTTDKRGSHPVLNTIGDRLVVSISDSQEIGPDSQLKLIIRNSSMVDESPSVAIIIGEIGHYGVCFSDSDVNGMVSNGDHLMPGYQLGGDRSNFSARAGATDGTRDGHRGKGFFFSRRSLSNEDRVLRSKRS